MDHRGDPAVDVLDPIAVTERMRAVTPDAVYHLAGWADVSASWHDPRTTLRVNAEGTLNVLEAARAAGVERVIAVASADVYGVVTESDLPLTEASALRPTSPYSASKVAADAVAHQAFLGHGLGVIRVRPFNHLGPGQSEHFVAPALAARIVRAERSGADRITVGNLSARRDFTDVRDIVRAYRLLTETGEPGAVYNICSGTDRSISEIAEILIGLSSRPMSLEHDPELMRPVDLPVLRGSSELLRSQTGWTPMIPLETTLADLLDDMRTRL